MQEVVLSRCLSPCRIVFHDLLCSGWYGSHAKRTCTASCSASISSTTNGLGAIRNLPVLALPAREPVITKTQFPNASQKSFRDKQQRSTCLHREQMVEESHSSNQRVHQIKSRSSVPFFPGVSASNRSLPVCYLLIQTVNRHNRESNFAHLNIDRCALVFSSGERTSFSLQCSMVPFSPAAWKRNCFVCGKGMFGHQSRGQPVTADPDSIDRNTERP